MRWPTAESELCEGRRGGVAIWGNLCDAAAAAVKGVPANRGHFRGTHEDTHTMKGLHCDVKRINCTTSSVQVQVLFCVWETLMPLHGKIAEVKLVLGETESKRNKSPTTFWFNVKNISILNERLPRWFVAHVIKKRITFCVMKCLDCWLFFPSFEFNFETYRAIDH